MSRSTHKVLFVHRSQLSNYFNSKRKRDLRTKQNLYRFMLNRYISISPTCFFWKRYSSINRHLINKKVCIYNGKIFQVANINMKCRGLKLGEFSVSRRRPIHKGKQKQIKRIIKKVSRKVNKR